MCEIVQQIVNEELRKTHEELREAHEKLTSTEKERDAALAEIARLKQKLAQKEKAELA